jgi:hypothetical protein
MRGFGIMPMAGLSPVPRGCDSSEGEAARLPACLNALASQVNGTGGGQSLASFCFANNSTDESAALARSMAERLPFEIDFIDADLPQ